MRTVDHSQLGRASLTRVATKDANVPIQPDLVGKDARLEEIFEVISLVAATDATVVIEGETGTGKELIARAVYENSARRDAPLIAMNCGAVPETLQESELFGHLPGAFTGASQRMIGRLEAADGGTIFLDEVSEMCHSLQVKLLRVLQSGEYAILGSVQPRVCDVRFIAATNRRLEDLVAEGKLRKDLYYRLNIIRLELPPLRERPGDIALMVQHFVGIYCRKYHKPELHVPNDVVRALSAYNFPGNVRELENLICRAVLLCRGDEITLDEFPPPLKNAKSTAAARRQESFREAKARVVEEFERSYLIAALRECGGIVTRAAGRIGLSERNFHAKLKQYGISSHSFRV